MVFTELVNNLLYGQKAIDLSSGLVALKNHV